VGRRSVPVASLLTTGALVAAASTVALERLVTAASTIILSSYMLANVAALVMRYSKLTGYRPTFRVPLTPIVQILSIALFIFFIVDLGIAGLIVASSLVVVSLGVYLLYGRPRHTGEFALLHLIEQITNRTLTGDHLERELRMIVHEKNEVVHDQVDEVLTGASVSDLPDTQTLGDLFQRVADIHAEHLGVTPRELERLLWEREREGSTALSEFVAVPHLIVQRPGFFSLLCVRTASGVNFSENCPEVKAVFVLAGSSDRRTLHLRTLAALAQIAMDKTFETEWLAARKTEQLREVLLLGERRRLGGTD
jgi:mannitol/fructose-specific phosphotransferase system IIA component (Ntr-type)